MSWGEEFTGLREFTREKSSVSDWSRVTIVRVTVSRARATANFVKYYKVYLEESSNLLHLSWRTEKSVVLVSSPETLDSKGSRSRSPTFCDRNQCTSRFINHRHTSHPFVIRRDMPLWSREFILQARCIIIANIKVLLFMSVISFVSSKLKDLVSNCAW